MRVKAALWQLQCNYVKAAAPKKCTWPVITVCTAPGSSTIPRCTPPLCCEEQGFDSDQNTSSNGSLRKQEELLLIQPRYLGDRLMRSSMIAERPNLHIATSMKVNY
ncbi:hypothetical protein Q8A67_002303 [Cirrhinus molitorella]|uniref:Uncharacterized protein n=1 Tax=Cirrhinus molitorella TaxID=172907 RepID=A0AA88QHU2_9TELE|nr:hypothetical protein Q8A67_002303 [Cirrhinus molitorella]